MTETGVLFVEKVGLADGYVVERRTGSKERGELGLYLGVFFEFGVGVVALAVNVNCRREKTDVSKC